MYSVYKIVFGNGKLYIGLTGKSVDERIKEHVWQRNSGTHRPIYTAMRKYKDNFTVEIIQNNLTIEVAEQLEIDTIAKLGTTDRKFGYNLSPGGNAGNIMSAEGKLRWKEKMKPRYEDTEYVKRITKQLIDQKNDPDYSKKQKSYVDNYFKDEANRIKHSEITKVTNNRRESKLKRAAHRGGKPFECVETGQVFELLQDAADVFKVDKRRIHSILTKRRKTLFKQYTFRYIEGKN